MTVEQHESAVAQPRSSQQDAPPTPVAKGSTRDAHDEKLDEIQGRLLQAAKILAHGAINAAFKARESAAASTKTSPTRTAVGPAKAVQS